MKYKLYKERKFNFGGFLHLRFCHDTIDICDVTRELFFRNRFRFVSYLFQCAIFKTFADMA